MRIVLLAALLVPVPALAQVMPGLWESTSTVTDAIVPGAPAGIANMMRGHPMTLRRCLTPEQAAMGPQEMMKTNKNCRFTRYAMAGGKLSAEMTCTQAGQTMTAVTTGTFTPTSYTANVRMVMTGRQAMTVISTGTGRRVGACK